jgi:hypothetical protein
MTHCKMMLTLVGTICALVWCEPSAGAQGNPGPATTEVHLVITDSALREDAEFPPLQKEDIKVKQGKNIIDPTALVPAKGDRAALQLMILIDDTLDSGVGNNLTDLKDFVKALPEGTQVGVGYMANTAISIAQNFTTDRELAAKAIRLPLGRLSTGDSPYLSLISLVKGWPQQKVRREVVMVADGIDRLRGAQPEVARAGPNTVGTVYHSMPQISIDAQGASEISQRNNVIVFPIFAPGVGRAARSSWDLQLGLSGLTKVADETGGECFSLSTTQLVSFKPYLDRLLKYLDNQYYLVFQTTQGKKDSLQRVNIKTAAKNSEILAADNVWVPGPPKAEKK